MSLEPQEFTHIQARNPRIPCEFRNDSSGPNKQTCEPLSLEMCNEQLEKQLVSYSFVAGRYARRDERYSMLISIAKFRFRSAYICGRRSSPGLLVQY